MSAGPAQEVHICHWGEEDKCCFALHILNYLNTYVTNDILDDFFFSFDNWPYTINLSSPDKHYLST